MEGHSYGSGSVAGSFSPPPAVGPQQPPFIGNDSLRSAPSFRQRRSLGSPELALSDAEAAAGSAATTFIPSIVLSCPVELVKLIDIPDEAFDDCEDPAGVRAFLQSKPWLHDTMEGFYRTAERHLRVTKRGTAVLTMPKITKAQAAAAAAPRKPTAHERLAARAALLDAEGLPIIPNVSFASSAGRFSDEADDERPPMLDLNEALGIRRSTSGGTHRSGSAQQAKNDEDDEEEEVTGTFRIQDACALLPIYDLDTGEPHTDMAMLAKYVRPPRRGSKIVGDGTAPLFAIRAAHEDLQRLADLIHSLSPQSTSALAHAFAEAHPFAVFAGRQPTKHAAAESEPSPSAEVGRGGDKDGDASSDDEDLRAALFGNDDGGPGAASGGAAAAADDDSDDDDLREALGLPPKPRKTPSRSASGANASSTLPPPPDGALLNPFRYGIGEVPPRQLPRSASTGTGGSPSPATQLGDDGATSSPSPNASTTTGPSPAFSVGTAQALRNFDADVAATIAAAAGRSGQRALRRQEAAAAEAPRMPVLTALAHREATSFAKADLDEFLADAQEEAARDKAAESAHVRELLRGARVAAQLLQAEADAARRKLDAPKDSAEAAGPERWTSAFRVGGPLASSIPQRAGTRSARSASGASGDSGLPDAAQAAAAAADSADLRAAGGVRNLAARVFDDPLAAPESTATPSVTRGSPPPPPKPGATSAAAWRTARAEQQAAGVRPTVFGGGTSRSSVTWAL